MTTRVLVQEDILPKPVASLYSLLLFGYTLPVQSYGTLCKQILDHRNVYRQRANAVRKVEVGEARCIALMHLAVNDDDVGVG